jgi:hypothetical protein
MVKTLAQKVRQVENLEPLKPIEVEAQSKKKVVYFIIKMEYEYEPRPSIRVINKKIKNE